MAVRVQSFADLQDKFFAYITDIGYCTMITVDRKARPRARIVQPIWEVTDGRPIGWITAYRTPVKVAHLANNPHTTFSYWNSTQNAVFIDTVTGWIDDENVKREVWDLFRRGSPPGFGYDPQNFWRDGPADSQYHVLRMEAWRVQVLRGTDLSSRIWQAPGSE